MMWVRAGWYVEINTKYHNVIVFAVRWIIYDQKAACWTRVLFRTMTAVRSGSVMRPSTMTSPARSAPKRGCMRRRSSSSGRRADRALSSTQTLSSGRRKKEVPCISSPSCNKIVHPSSWCSFHPFDFSQISMSKQRMTGTWIWAFIMIKVNASWLDRYMTSNTSCSDALLWLVFLRRRRHGCQRLRAHALWKETAGGSGRAAGTATKNRQLWEVYKGLDVFIIYCSTQH